MLGEAILWAVIVTLLLLYTISLWIPVPTMERWKARLRRLVGRR